MNRTISAGVLLMLIVAGCQSEEHDSGRPRFEIDLLTEDAQPRSAATAAQQNTTAKVAPGPGSAVSDELRRLSPEASHRLMVKTLQEIDARLPDENPYLGDLEARRLRRQIASLPSGTSELQRYRLCFQLGREELRLGAERAAIDQLTTAFRLLASSEVQTAVGQDGIAELAFELGVAWMRFAETANCCQRNTPDSCIVPIRGAGIHSNQEPARTAIGYFKDALKNSSGRSRTWFRARWLLNIASMTVGDYPDLVPPEYQIPVETFESEVSFPHFTNISSSLGIDTFSMCGGAVADTFDGDEHLDLFVSTWDSDGPLRFFHNNGDGTFEDRSATTGLEGICGGLNLLQADYNNDRHLDFLVLRGAWFAGAGLQPNSLIRNNGDGTFTDVTFSAGLGDVHYPTQTASWADYDNDGDLDLYIGNEQGKGVTAPCQLFQNQGDGTFIDVARAAGVTNDRFTKAVVWGDFDNDRWPDLYVSNLGAENRLYRNQHDGTFVDVARRLNVTEPTGSFPAWFFDVDNDGVLDLFVSSYTNQIEHLAAASLNEPIQLELAKLYRGTGQGKFEEVAREFELTSPTTPMGSNFGDLNGDGFLDFYLGTGDPAYFNLMPNVMYLNRDGRSFVDVTMSGGFGHLQKGHAVVFADLDNDGDQDIFEQLGGAFRGDKFFDALYENPGFDNHWLTVQLVGVQSNRSAIGARIQVDVQQGDATRTIFKHVNSGGSFGANPLRQTLGLGGAERILRVHVFWPTTNQTQTFEDVPMDAAIRIIEGQPEFISIDLPAFRFQGRKDSEFESASTLIRHGD